jgi:hypothetical protein
MSSNAYRTAIIQLIAQLRARGQSGQYILYQVMPDELNDPTLISWRAYSTRNHADVVMISAGLSSIDEPVPEGELLLPLGVVVAQLKRLYGVTS